MGCTNSKERPRTPPPDAALQNVVSDGDGFWAANGEQRASREATPLKAAADPFQTVDLTNPETAAAASTPAPAPAADVAAAFGAPTAPALVPADAGGQARGGIWRDQGRREHDRGPSARGGGPGGRGRDSRRPSACDGGGRGAANEAVADQEALH